MLAAVDIQGWIDAVLLAVVKGLSAFSDFVPKLLGAGIVFLIGWIIAGICKRLTLRILDILQLEPFAEKVGLSAAFEKLGAPVSPPELIGDLVKWAVVVVFLSPAVEILGLTQITVILHSLLAYIPNVLVAIVILMLGAIFADLVAQFVTGTAQALEPSTANVLGVVCKYAILIFAALAALSQLRIAESMINTLLTGLVGMLALAGGLAFGLGGRETAAEILEAIKKSLKGKS